MNKETKYTDISTVQDLYDISKMITHSKEIIFRGGKKDFILSHVQDTGGEVVFFLITPEEEEDYQRFLTSLKTPPERTQSNVEDITPPDFGPGVVTDGSIYGRGGYLDGKR